jgi:hypothetical protein
MKDFDIEGLAFKEPLTLFYTDDKGPKIRVVPSMEELVSLLEEIEDNEWTPGVGALTIQFQLWTVLARKFLFKTDTA